MVKFGVFCHVFVGEYYKNCVIKITLNILAGLGNSNPVDRPQREVKRTTMASAPPPPTTKVIQLFIARFKNFINLFFSL